MGVIVKKLSGEQYTLKINGLESVHLRNGAVYYNILKDKIGIKEAGSCERLTDLLPADAYEVEGKKHQSIQELAKALLDVINSEKDYFEETQSKIERFERENQPKIDQIFQEAQKLEAIKAEAQESKFKLSSRDTRHDNSYPKDYGEALSFELKLSGAVGSPSNDGYVSVITAKSNRDLKAVSTYQIGGCFSGLYFRNTNVATAWDQPETSSWRPWQKILTSEEINKLPQASKDQVKYLLGIDQEGQLIKVDIHQIK